MSTHRRGFTLLELLIVVAIIALLASILFPAFARAREKARQAACQSNLKQLSLACLQYTQDYDEKFPFNPNGSVNYVWAGVGWAGLVYPYVKSKQIFSCPDDTTKVTGSNVAMTYAFNADIGLGLGDQVTGAGEADLTAASRTFLFSETTKDAVDPSNALEASSPAFNGMTVGPNNLECVVGYVGGGLNPLTGPATCTAFNYGTNSGPSGLFHSGGADYAYADGHVKWLRGSQVSGGYNAANSLAGEGDGSNGLTSYCTKAGAPIGCNAGRNAAGTSGPFDAAGDSPAGTFSIR